MNITNCSAVNFVNGMAIMFEHENSTGRRLLRGTGRCGIRAGNYIVSPDAQWMTGMRLRSRPNLVFEVGVFQSVKTLLTKVRAYLLHSTSSMNVLVFKVWYDPLPSKVAMVAAMWCKQGCVAQESDCRAVQFVSFGNRPPTAAELAEFDAGAEELGMQVPAMTGVTGGPDHADSIEANKQHPALLVRLPATVLFAMPELIGPNRYFVLPDLVFPLTEAKVEVVEGIEEDICRKVYQLSPSELQLIVNDAEVQASQPFLYNFAMTELDALSKCI